MDLFPEAHLMADAFLGRFTRLVWHEAEPDVRVMIGLAALRTSLPREVSPCSSDRPAGLTRHWVVFWGAFAVRASQLPEGSHPSRLSFVCLLLGKPLTTE